METDPKPTEVEELKEFGNLIKGKDVANKVQEDLKNQILELKVSLSH